MKYQTIILKKEQGIGTITLNRPEKLNPFNDDMRSELKHALEDVASDDKIRAVILTGAGRAFSTGGTLEASAKLIHDLCPTAPADRQYIRSRMHPLVKALYTMEKPIIAMINGPVSGEANSYALACDLRIGSERARFNVGFTGLANAMENGDAWFLVQHVGLGRATEIALLYDWIGAEDAFRMGLLNRLAPAGKLEEETMTIATRLANGPSIAIGLNKTLLHKAAEGDLDTAMELGAIGGTIGESTDDHIEAIAAFREKREPQFKGSGAAMLPAHDALSKRGIPNPDKPEPNRLTQKSKLKSQKHR